MFEHLELFYLCNLDLYDRPKIREYKQAIKCWLMFKGKIQSLNISTNRLTQNLKKDLSWYSNLSKNPRHYLKEEINDRTFWKYIYEHLLPELQAFYDALESEDSSPTAAQLQLEV